MDLDSRRAIAIVDKNNMLKDLENTPSFYSEALRMTRDIDPSIARSKVNRVLFLGMGGSAIVGQLIRDWSYDRRSIDIDVVMDYQIPRNIDKRTLAVAISYSGNTEETLNACLEAIRTKSTVIGISSGGLLEKLCQAKKVMHIKVPSGLPQRVSLPFLLTLSGWLIELTGHLSGFLRELESSIPTLQDMERNLSVTASSAHNQAKTLALQIAATIPIIYGYREYSSAATRWKTQFNENSKIVAMSNVFPELNHNEIVGWDQSDRDLLDKLSAIFIQDQRPPKDISQQIEITKNIIKSKTNRVYEVFPKGRSRLSRMLSVIYLGDFVSFYLAVVRKINPTPVDAISKIKNALAKRHGSLDAITKMLGVDT